METSRATVSAADPKASMNWGLLRDNSACPALLTLWLGTLCIVLGSPALAAADNDQTPKSSSAAQTAPPDPSAEPPKVELGRLLKLPDSYLQPTANRRGVNRSEWENRFEGVRLDLSSAKQALAKAQTELGETASDSSSWSVAAPGAIPNPENTPLSYKLRQEIRRQREVVEHAERQLRSLEIEADLADVPEQWRASEIAP